MKRIAPSLLADPAAWAVLEDFAGRDAERFRVLALITIRIS